MAHGKKLRIAATVAAATALALSLAGPATARPSSSGNTDPILTSAALTAGSAASAVRSGDTMSAAVNDFWTPERLRAAKVLGRSVPKGAVERALRTGDAPAAKAGKAGSVAASVVRSAAASRTATPEPLAGSNAQYWGNRGRMPATTSGKVFFTKVNTSGGIIGNYVCSGTAVNSEAKNLVVTAGHCVHGGKGGTWHRNWIFIPDYYNGQEPYGRYSARIIGTTWQWVNNSWPGSAAHDVGMVVTNPYAGVRLVNRVGGQGIMWNQAKHFYAYAFGYPAAAPFDGRYHYYCSNPTFNDGPNLGIGCNMTGGASGGGWLRSFNGTSGYVNSVNSYKYGSHPTIYGPYFGNEVRDLYNVLRNRA